ncbi:MAG: hypothetical protein NC410_09045 [Oscillibacter sp.]|nr:hypothetical protein [Oscillibacter sp.]
MSALLKSEFEWYLANQDKLVEKYNGKYLVIKDCNVVGSYDREDEAYFDSESKYGLGNFLIQLCTPGNTAYTQMFSSRVIF